MHIALRWSEVCKVFFLCINPNGYALPTSGYFGIFALHHTHCLSPDTPSLLAFVMVHNCQDGIMSLGHGAALQ